MTTVHRIRYRRPETPWSLSQMTTQTAQDAAIQVQRLVALGYTVSEVTPPLESVAARTPDQERQEQ